MLKRSFFNRQSAAITLLYKPNSNSEAIVGAREAEFNGADGIALELSNMPKEERTLESFQKIIKSVQLPFMFIDYRKDLVHGDDDDARQEDLLIAAEAGAEVIDVMGDLYQPSPYELSTDPAAIKKQMALIDKIHSIGAKVVMSSHMTSEVRTAEQVLAQLQEQSRRGADILKIVTACNTEEDFLETMRTTMLLNRELDKPFIHLTNGKFSHFHRYIGPKFGVAVEFAVNDCRPPYTQPKITAFKGVMQNLCWDFNNIK